MLQIIWKEDAERILTGKDPSLHCEIKGNKVYVHDVKFDCYLPEVIERVVFERCVFNSVSLAETTNIETCTFDSCNLDEACLTYVNMKYNFFNKSSLVGAEFDGTNLKGSIFELCDMNNVYFEKINLTSVRFIRCLNMDTLRLRRAIGNSYEIASIQMYPFNVVFNGDMIQIGCQMRTREQWEKMTDEEIWRMSTRIKEWRQTKGSIFALHDFYKTKTADEIEWSRIEAGSEDELWLLSVMDEIRKLDKDS